ncbi:MAG: Holliday junction resolvase RecU [Candidatus Izemoplasma sp.]|nr:Holliday junction resolvase RecU [Candidatus Izemoplasma sp.]
MVNYPNKKQSFKRKKVSYSNRGMSFEALINEANEYYLTHDIAVIHKKPIPIQVVKVHYPSREGAVIKEAYYKVPSTTDYNGIYQGFYIDFEAKETRNKTSFPLKNIHHHQITHMQKVAKHGGIAFILIYFKRHDTMHLLDIAQLTYYVNRAKKGRKSITYEEICQNGYPLDEGYAPRIAYLNVVDQLIAHKKSD